MSSNVDVNKQYAMQNVSTALRLDGEGNSPHAYRKYLECIEFMSHQLFLDASQGLHASDSTLRFIALCRQCLDRVDELIRKLQDESNLSRVRAGTASNIGAPSRPAVVANQGSSTFQKGVLNESRIVGKSLSPMELAQWQNDYLVALHKTRIEKMVPNNQMTANLSLSLQRRMMENLAIARQQQLALEKKKEERLQRLQEEADRRFRCRTGMSPDELGRRKLYTEILEYEQDEKWLMELRKKVPEKCKDTSFVIDSIHGIVCDSDHPLTRLMKGYQHSIYQRTCDAADLVTSPQATSPLVKMDLSNREGGRIDAAEEALQNIARSSTASSEAVDSALGRDGGSCDSSSSKATLTRIIGTLVSEVQTHLDNLETMFVVTYEDFDDDEIRCTLRESLEDYFFQPIWPHVLSLFRHSAYANEKIMSEVMKTYSNASPGDIGVSEKFSLCRSQSDTTLIAQLPYETAVRSFQSIVHMASPSKKLDCIVQSSQLICQCIDEFYANSGASSPQLGADEMLPVLSYIIVKTEQPLLVTECSALMEFIDESSLMGERGYCLTSAMTAINFLLTLASKSSPDVKP